MTDAVYHLQLTEHQRVALIELQFMGSALAVQFDSDNPLYQQWVYYLEQVQSVLWHPLAMGTYFTHRK